MCRELLRATLNLKAEDTVDETIAAHRERYAFKDELAWLRACAMSEDSELAAAACQAIGDDKYGRDPVLRARAKELLRDSDSSGLTLRRLCGAYVKYGQVVDLTLIAELTPLDRPIFDARLLQRYFKGLPLTRIFILSFEEKEVPLAGESLASFLRQRTGQDFGQDVEAWKAWIESEALKAAS